MAAGVRVTQREQNPRPGRETARQWGEEQPNLSPRASEDEARDMQDSVGAAPSLQSCPGDPCGAAAWTRFPIWFAWAKEVSGESAAGLSLLMVKAQRSRAS